MKTEQSVFGYVILPTTVNDVYILMPFSDELLASVKSLQDQYSGDSKKVWVPLGNAMAIRIKRSELGGVITTGDDLLSLMLNSINDDQAGAIPVLKSLVIPKILSYSIVGSFRLSYCDHYLSWSFDELRGDNYLTYPMSVRGFNRVYQLMNHFVN